ncbi:MAG: alpha/beta fold hydrolase [Acidobacteriota bacterium]
MTETPLFFGPAGQALFGVLHDAVPAATGSAFVFCHPLVEEKLWSHRVFVTFARHLAAAGHPVLRFDYRGSGDSDGAFSDCSLDTLTSDIAAAVDEVRRRTGVTSVSLLGLRAGATLASIVAASPDANLDRLVLWAPIVDGARYMQELLRINLTTQMATHKEIRFDREALVEQMRLGSTVNVDGYEMSYPLYADFTAVKLTERPAWFAGPTLIVQVDRQPGRVDAELQRLTAACPHATLVAAQEEPFWKEIARFYERAASLSAVTSAWLK